MTEGLLFCFQWIDVDGDQWGGTYCKLPFGHDGEHSPHYPNSDDAVSIPTSLVIPVLTEESGPGAYMVTVVESTKTLIYVDDADSADDAKRRALTRKGYVVVERLSGVDEVMAEPGSPLFMDR